MDQVTFVQLCLFGRHLKLSKTDPYATQASKKNNPHPRKGVETMILSRISTPKAVHTRGQNAGSLLLRLLSRCAATNAIKLLQNSRAVM